MERLNVIGNISRDLTRYPDHRGGPQLGGAALFVSLAAAQAGCRAAPVCVLGTDLAHLPKAPGLDRLDWSARLQAAGISTVFDLEYDPQGELMAVGVDYGVAEGLTRACAPARGPAPAQHSTYHVCCRRPLNVAPVLGRLAKHAADFSVDFFLPSAEEMIRAAAPWLPRASTLFVNATEYRLLEAVIDCGTLAEVIVSDGPRPAVVRCFGHQAALAIPPPHPPREVTGAGDTLAGTYLARRSLGATATQALTEATAAAARFVASPPLPIPAPRRS